MAEFDTLADDLLVTVEELAVVANREIDPGEMFALAVCAAVTVVMRDEGDPNWTISTIPKRARLIARLVARDYYVNPDRAISETVGPLSQRLVDDVVRGLALSPDDRAIIARLAGEETPGAAVSGLGVVSTTRGPMETWGPPRARGDFTVPIGRGGRRRMPLYPEPAS